MRSFAFVALVVLTQTVSAQPAAGTAIPSNCKLDEALANKIRLTTAHRDELRGQIEGELPFFGITVPPLQGKEGVNPPRNLEPNPAFPGFRFIPLQGMDADNLPGRLDSNPVYQRLRIALSEAEVELATLRAMARAQCAEQMKKDSPRQD